MNKLLTFLAAALLLNAPLALQAAPTPEQTDQEIQQLLIKLNRKSHDKLQRITLASQYFLGKPYVLGPLGEGAHGRFDKDPLYRTDMFDCTTYVSTVLALANSKTLPEFKQQINAVRYKDGKVSYLTRNHFMSTDWNINNAANHKIRDITGNITNDKGQAVAKQAQAIIDKPNWLKSAKIGLIKPNTLPLQTRQRRLALLKKQASQVHAERGRILYLPLNRLFNSKGKANDYLFSQIPSGSIIEIVRPNWNIKAKAGTNLNVSHLGFAIRTPKGLMFREASQVKHKVIDIPLQTYLKQYLKSPTIKGINVQAIL